MRNHFVNYPKIVRPSGLATNSVWSVVMVLGVISDNLC